MAETTGAELAVALATASSVVAQGIAGGAQAGSLDAASLELHETMRVLMGDASLEEIIGAAATSGLMLAYVSALADPDQPLALLQRIALELQS